MTNKKRIKVVPTWSWTQISRAIHTAYLSANSDTWNVPSYYEQELRAQLKKYLPTKKSIKPKKNK